MSLPKSAMEVLSRLGEDLSRKPIAAAVTKSLGVREVRGALRNAARAATDGQIPACLYDPGHGSPLVVLRVDDLGDSAAALKRSSAEHDDEGRPA